MRTGGGSFGSLGGLDRARTARAAEVRRGSPIELDRDAEHRLEPGTSDLEGPLTAATRAAVLSGGGQLLSRVSYSNLIHNTEVPGITATATLPGAAVETRTSDNASVLGRGRKSANRKC